MKCSKRLLVCLMFQTLLVISEAGRNSKANGQKGLGTRGTSPGRSNSVSPTRTNVGRNHASGQSHSHRASVQPPPFGAGPWGNSQPPATSYSNRAQVPATSYSNRAQASATSYSNRAQVPATSYSNRAQAPATSYSNRAQVPATSYSNRAQVPDTSRFRFRGSAAPSVPASSASSFSPQNPLSPLGQPSSFAGSSRHQTPAQSLPFRPPGSINAWGRLPSNNNAQPTTSNYFPPLATPKLTHADAAKRGSEILKSSSSSSVSSGSSGFNSGSSRSSITSLSSFSSGSSSSWNRPEPIGLSTVKSTASTKSKASPQSCIDNTKKIPKVIAPAENCFDYFKLAVAWSPSFAYKERQKGQHIRDKIHKSWFIHGLWPTMFGRHQDPMPGCRRFDITFNKNRIVENKLLAALEHSWYTILAKGWSDNTRFWEHEFSKHGSCASRSSVIQDDVNYFKRTLELFTQLNIGSTLYANGIHVGATVKLNDIINSIEDRTDTKIDFKLVSNDRTQETYLSELIICYDTNLRVMDCPDVYYRLDRDLDFDVKYLDKLP